jgi:hypothetical protein
MLVLLAHTPLRRAGNIAMLPPATEGVELELAEGSSIKEVASFFVDSFWAASTTYGDVEFSTRERKQLTAQMADDFHHRYCNSWHSSGTRARRFFSSRLLVARGAKGGSLPCLTSQGEGVTRSRSAARDSP